MKNPGIFLSLCILPLLGTGSVFAAGPAGVKLDGTIGAAAQVLPGPLYNITQNLGKLSGGNLFFSFQYFNVATGEVALYTTTSPGINNVISRVTGGFSSTIDGGIVLQAAYGAPNFFFINPSGVTFTSNAVVDVPAAFHISTADYLKFSDGGMFYANPATQSALSTAAPEAFGFLGTSRAAVNIQGATLLAGPIGDGEFDIVAGDVSIDGEGFGGGISNYSGNVRLAAVGSQPVEVPLSGPYSAQDGTVTIQNSGFINTSGAFGTAAGSVEIDASAITILNGGLIQTAGSSLSSAGAVTLNSKTLTIDANGGFSQTGVQSYAGDGGALPIVINASGNVLLNNGGQIYSTALGAAHGADIDLTAGSLMITGGNLNYITGLQTETAGAGNGGAITVNAGTVTIDGTAGPAGSLATEIGATSDSVATGGPGPISVTATGNIGLLNNGTIEASLGGLSASGGDITVSAGSLTISSNDSTLNTGILYDAAGAVAQTGGSISVNVTGPIALGLYSVIGTQGLAQASAGSVSVQGGSVQISGDPNGVSLSSIGSLAGFSGNGSTGDVTITSRGAISLTNDASIESASLGSGTVGNVVISGSSLGITTGPDAGLTAVESSSFGGGAGGNVSINLSGALTISAIAPTSTPTKPMDIAAISTIAGGTGSSGNIVISAGSLTIDGANGTGTVPFEGTNYSFPQIVISTGNVGSSSNAGRISITTTGPITLENGGYISTAAQTTSTGNAGSISITAPSLNIDGGTRGLGGIIADTLSSGSAGQISLNISGALTLASGGVISDGASATGNAGNIVVNAGSLDLKGGKTLPTTGGAITYGTSISSSVNQGASGQAGSVTVDVTGPITLANGSEISTSTIGAGSAGAVSVSTTGTLTIGGGSGNGALIGSAARSGAQGQPGTVSVSAATLAIESNGQITVEDDRVQTGLADSLPHRITVQAGSILLDGGAIVATSTGPYDASSINIDYSRSLTADDGKITTSAFAGNGGPITVDGGGTLWLSGSQITTSVLASSSASALGSNGGNIQISAPLIVMNTAAIQANTDVPLAAGGDITISAGAIIPSFQSFVLGGRQQTFDPALLGQNLVQAVAADGVSGTLNVTIPTLDLGSSLLAFTGKPATPTPLGRGLCGFTRGSSLSTAGRGGLPASAGDPLWFDPNAPAAGTATKNVEPPLADHELPVMAFLGLWIPGCR